MTGTPDRSVLLRGLGSRWAGLACLAAGLLLTTLLLHSVWLGAPSRAVVSLGKPKVVMAMALFFLVLWGALSARGKGPIGLYFLKLSLLGLSVVVCLVPGEIMVRRFLDGLQGEGGLEQLQKWAGGGELKAHSFTPLLAICRLSGDRRLLYDLQPGLDMDFGHRSLRTNLQGMRAIREYDPGDNGVVRLVGIGDSGMFGWGVNQGEDYLSVLERNLNAAQPGGPRVDVLNFAVPGYNTGQEVEMLRQRALAFKPQIVIVGWCDNDFGPPFFVTARRDYTGFKKSFLYSLLFYRKELLAPPAVCKPSEIDPKLIDPWLLEYTGVPGVRKALDELRELGRSGGFRVLVFGPMRAETVTICRELGLDYFNTYERVDASKYPADYALHFIHPSAGGHRVLAEHLQAELQRLGWLPGGPAVAKD